MIRNYFKIALRTLFRNKLYTTLNVAGLTFGLTCFILIGLFLFDELTFDRQHTNVHRVYRIVEHKTVNGEATIIAGAGYKVAMESKAKIAEVENATTMVRMGRANLVNPENPEPFQETVTTVDENFLQILDFPLSQGDARTALREPNTIIINEDLAKRLFGKTDVIGKMVDFQFGVKLHFFPDVKSFARRNKGHQTSGFHPTDCPRPRSRAGRSWVRRGSPTPIRSSHRWSTRWR